MAVVREDSMKRKRLRKRIRKVPAAQRKQHKSEVAEYLVRELGHGQMDVDRFVCAVRKLAKTWGIGKVTFVHAGNSFPVLPVESEAAMVDRARRKAGEVC